MFVWACDKAEPGSTANQDRAAESRSTEPEPISEPAEPLVPAAEPDAPNGPVAEAPAQPVAPAEPVALAGAAAADPQVAGPQADEQPLTISRSRCARAGCELAFTFSHSMVRGPRKGRSRAVSIELEPAQPGAWKWTSPTRLVFEPRPGALRWGHKVTVTVSRATARSSSNDSGPELARPWTQTFRVPYFQAAGKVARWPVIQGRPRFVAFLNGRRRRVGAGPLYLLYDQPVAPARVARATRLSHGNQALPVRVTRPDSIAHVYRGDIDTRLIVAITAKTRALPEDGEPVELQYPRLLDSAVPETDSRQLTVRTRFALDSITPEQRDDDTGRVPLTATFRLAFDNRVSAQAVKDALSVKPRPRSVGVSWVWGSEAYVVAELEPGRAYRMTVSGRMRDELGNRLGKKHTLRFQAHDLPPALALPSGALVLERGHARVPVRATNARDIEVRYHAASSPAAFMRMLRGGCTPGQASRQWTLARRIEPNTEIMRQAELTAGKRDGLGCLEVKATATGSRATSALRAAIPVQVTGLGVTAKVHAQGLLVWATHLGDATPAAGAAVALVDSQGQTLATATTDAQGVARLDSANITSRAGLRRSGYLVVTTDDDRAVATLAEDQLSQPWQFGMRGDVKDVAALSAAVFTDRGVYRPRDEVHVKLLAREADGRAPATGAVQVTVSDPRGKEITRQSLDLDAYGGAHLDVDLAEDAAVGRYAVRVRQGDHVASHKFLVEEYRVPTFKVDVTADQPWAAGKDARATIEARYHHGGDLAARQVRYTVAREEVPFTPAGYPGFVFSKVGWEAPEARRADGILARKDTRLDGQGRLAVDFRAGHPSTLGPMRYVIDASVTDVDRQVYRGRLARVVHPATYYIGVRPTAARILAAGDVLEVPVVAVTPQGRARAGVRAHLRLERVDSHTTARLASASSGSAPGSSAGASAGASVQLDNRPVTRTVDRCRVRTKERAVLCKLRVPRAGRYRLVASARDDRRALVHSGFAFTASGAHTIAWPRFEHERIDLIADKPAYEPGDVARLMVQSPFAKARGLLTIERDQVIEHRLFEIDGDAPVLEVPIGADHAPNVFVSAILLQPRVHGRKDAVGFETGAPSFRMGYAELAVAPSAHALDVRVSSQTTAHPRSELDIDLEVRDAGGRPARGLATVMVVDEAVLGMTNYQTPDPLAQIFTRRPLGVRTLASVLELPHSRRSRHEQIFAGGDGGPGFSLSHFAPQMRHLFESTAYWNPAVPIGEDGRARVTVDLPDNVTTYRIMAVVAGQGARAGSGQGQVVVRKPLMVQPVVPRFVYPGDKLRVEARVFNGTEEEGRVQVSAELVGLSRAGAERGSADTHTLSVPAGDAGTVGFAAEAVGGEADRQTNRQARVRFVARMGAHTDAVEATIPVLEPGVRRRIVRREPVASRAELSVDLPAERVPGTGSVEVVVSSSRLSQLKESVDYLMGYPNGCIEQTTSRAYPLVVLEDLLPDMGVTVDPDELRTYAEAGVKRLLSFQTSAGGLSYWPGSDEPHAFGTAFGLTALIAAKERGYDVPDAALRTMGDYLEQSLGQGTIREQMPHGGMADADTRALFVMTLGRLGRPQPGHLSALWRARDKLTAFGLAFLAVAAHEMPHRDAALVDAMLAEVRAKAREEEQEAYYQGKADGGWSMGSPLRTHAGALLAFAQSAPGHEMQQKLLTGLLNRQRRGLWGNTQENVFGIMAVARSIAGAGADRSSDVAVTINGAPATGMEPMGKRGRRVVVKDADLAGAPGRAATQRVVIENRAATPAFVTVRAEYDVALTPRTMAAHKSGFEVTRRYERLDGRAVNPRRIALGSLVRVRVRIQTDDKHNYVAIHDKLPAGLEPLNANLATTETVGRGELSPAARRGLQVLSYSEVRDARVAFYANELPAGSYEFVYLARATTPGTFLRPAAAAEAMYQPDASGASAMDYVVIR